MLHTTRQHSLENRNAPVLACAAALALVVLTACFLPWGSQAHAETAAEKQAEAEAALANLNALQETLDRLEAEYGEAQMAQAEAEASRDEAKQRIDDLNAEIADVQGRLDGHVRDMYRTGSVSFIEMLLGAASFEEFAMGLDMANKVSQSGADLVDHQRSLKQEAEEQATVYEEQAAVAAQKSAEVEEAAAQAQATIADMQATYDSLSAEAERLLEEERAAQRAAEEARAAAIVAESAARAQAEAEAQARAQRQQQQQQQQLVAAGPDNAGGATTDAGTIEVQAAPTYDAAADAEPVVSESVAYEGGSDTVSRAYACLGAPYVWGGVGPNGYDCSGLVSYCLTGQHTRLGTTYTFMGWPQVSDPQPGDVCVNWSHTGIYIGGGQMIHAADYGTGVIIGPVQSGMIIVRY